MTTGMTIGTKLAILFFFLVFSSACDDDDDELNKGRIAPGDRLELIGSQENQKNEKQIE